MHIQKIHCFHLRIPLRLTFGQANQSTQTSDSMVLRIETTAGIVGYGECGPRTYVSGEDAAQVRASIQRMAPELYLQAFEQIGDIEQFTQQLLENDFGPAAVCALELALLDAWSKTYGQDLRTALGAEEYCTLPYSGIVPFGSWEKLAPILKQFRLRDWKFKATVNMQENITRIKQLQTLLGQTESHNTKHSIRLDANGGWTLAQARENIEQALAAGVSSFEQPIAVTDEQGAQILTEAYGTKACIMADEALVTYADAQRLIDNGSYNHFNLKLSKNGGLFNSLRIYRLARQHGIPCQLGAQYGETSLLSAAAALFADLVPDLTAREGALGTWLLQEDLTTQALMMDRRGKLPPRAAHTGLGIEVDELRLNRYSLRTDFWRKPTSLPNF